MNKVDFFLLVRCLYNKKKIIHGRLEMWNFSPRVQLDITLIHCAHSCDIELNIQGEIPYLHEPIYYSLHNQSQLEIPWVILNSIPLYVHFSASCLQPVGSTPQLEVKPLCYGGLFVRYP